MTKENHIIPDIFEVSIKMTPYIHEGLNGLIANNATSTEVLHFLLGHDKNLLKLNKTRFDELQTESDYEKDITNEFREFVHYSSNFDRMIFNDAFLLPDIILLNITRLTNFIFALIYLHKKNVRRKDGASLIDILNEYISQYGVQLNRKFKGADDKILKAQLEYDWFSYMFIRNLVESDSHNPITVEHIKIAQNQLIGLRPANRTKIHL